MDYLELITPTNIVTEKEKFFASSDYSPIFEYNWQQSVLDVYLTKHPKMRAAVAALQQQNLAEIMSYNTRKFAYESNTELDALADSALATKPNSAGFEMKDLIAEYSRVFKLLGIDYRLDIVDETGFAARPMHKQKRLLLNKNATFEFMDLAGSVRHETCHIVRYINGAFNDIKRSANYLPTEEGLASFVQDYSGETSNSSLFQHAAEYKASEIGVRGSLREIYNYLVSLGFGVNLAWERAIRHKFGFVNTALPGDLLKPAMYFVYEQKIRLLSREDILKLFIAKISIDDLAIYPAYQGQISKALIEETFLNY